ncbi:MAG: hypothetical protein K8S25_12575, partial [Alphaproteobacteria bacterium]|nr:hypothetical protein [Alphaproteobacteria bacterium]
MGEATDATENKTFRRWQWREVARLARDALVAIPDVIGAGWRRDAGRRVLFVPVLLGLGIGVYFALPFEPPLWLVPGAAAIVVAWIAYRRTAGASNITAALGACAAIAAGFALAVVRAQSNDVDVLRHETKTVSIIGRVTDLEPTDRGRTRILLTVYSIEPRLREKAPTR